MIMRIVTGCDTCPCLDMNDMSTGYTCNIMKDVQKESFVKESKKTFMPETPDWCPLKTSDITLQFIKIPKPPQP